uniref:UDP-glycosyltransferase n=1 Tax=Xylotrechus quadripes TaxID=554073 RepID=A0A6G7SEU8_9CUCU|nr:UDP-glycosyltransferase [Xylotrechus quadripes]
MQQIVLLPVLLFVSYCRAANILAVIPTPSYSHQIAFTAIWKELSLRGHSVTLITTDPLNDPKLTNLTEIDIKWAYKYMADVTSKITDSQSFSMWNMAKTFGDMFLPMMHEQMNYPPVQELLQDKSKHFDVVIVEHIYPEFLGFAEVFNCPKIFVGSLDTWTYVHNYIGNFIHPILYPELGAYFFDQLSFKERVISTLYSWHIWKYHMLDGLVLKEKILHEHFNTTVPLVSLLQDLDLLILNVNPVIQGVRAVGPTTINIGGYRPAVTKPPPLPKDLQEFLDGAKEGFIYFSLGSNVKSKDLSKETLNSVISTLRELPYKVLWKFEADTLPGKPENVKLVKWTPQQAVLAHRNIKLFITQGGLQSMEEGIYHEVPFVVIPFFADQEQNAGIMRSRGIAKIVNKDPFIKQEELKEAVLEVIQNPRYKETVQRIKRLSLDFPMTGLEQAIWWIEHVIRNNGTKHLRNPTADLPTYQYYLLDVLGFFALVFFSSLLLVIIVARFLIRTFRQHIKIHISLGKLKAH